MKEVARIGQMRLERVISHAALRMKSWIDDFVWLNGGTIGHGYEASFTLHILNYTRTKWLAEGRQPIPLGTIQKLWYDKLNSLLQKPGRIFICVFCNGKHGMDTVFDHIKIEHSREMGWTAGTSSNFWQGQEWPAGLPIRGFGEPFKGADVSAEALAASLKQRYQTCMTEILSKTQPFHMLPDSHRLFLWFRLSIAMCLREHDRAPDITIFALAADAIHRSGQNRPHRELLGCGICGAYQSKKKKAWLWATLKQHFVAHNNFDKVWPEKMLVLPSTADISESCSRIKDKTVRRQWIKLVKEADGELGGMLDDAMRLEEDAACSKGIQSENGRESVNGEGKGRADHSQFLKRRLETELLRNPKHGFERDGDGREKRLKVETLSPAHAGLVHNYKNIPTPPFGTAAKSVGVLAKPAAMPPARAQEARAVGTATKFIGVLPIKPVTMPPARAREARAVGTVAKSIGMLPIKPAEKPSARKTWAPGTAAKSTGALRIKPVETPPARVGETRAPGTAAKPAGVPTKSVTTPLARAQETRAVGTATKSIGVLPIEPIEIPSAILQNAQETLTRAKIANPKPNRLPEIYKLKVRSRSPSVDMDIEALFADA